MKKYEIINMIIFCMFAVCFAMVLRNNVSKYAETGIVTNVENVKDGYLIEFTLSNGNIFEYVAEDGDIYEGEYYSLLMDSNYTGNTVKDDKILEIKYCAF